MNEIIFEKIMQEEYDQWAAKLPDHKWCCNTLHEVGFIIEALELNKNDRILDLFCSWGRHVIELRKSGYDITGLDKSKELISKAHEIAAASNLKGGFFAADILEYEGTEKYDTIYSLHASVFEAWRAETEIIEYLRKIYNILMKGGKYLFGWNNNWNRADGAEKRWKRILEEKGIKSFADNLPFHYYGYDEQRRIIEKSGFKIQNVLNDYDINKTFKSSEPGLVFIIEK